MARRWSVDLIFWNGGRSRNPDDVTRSQRSLRARAQAALDKGRDEGRAVLVGQVELNEGDRGYDDWAILTKVWAIGASIWAALHQGAREGLLYATSRSTVVSSTTRRAGRAVKRQSPPRPVHVDRFEPEHDGDPYLTVLLFHSAAGAKNGKRPRAVHAVLLVSWWLSRGVARRAAKRARRRGDHVVYLADVNDRTWKALTRHEAEQVQDGPDVIGVIPGPGWDARLERQEDVPTYVERLHQGLHARATFTRATVPGTGRPGPKRPR